MLDSMEEVITMQRELEDVVPGGQPTEEMYHQVTCGLGIIEETLEYLNALGRKPWRPIPLSDDQQLEELCDILHFFAATIIRSKFSWYQIVKRYESKHQENLDRWERGKEGDYSWDKRSEKEEL